MAGRSHASWLAVSPTVH